MLSHAGDYHQNNQSSTGNVCVVIVAGGVGGLACTSLSVSTEVERLQCVSALRHAMIENKAGMECRAGEVTQSPLAQTEKLRK